MALTTFARDTPVSEILPTLERDGCFIVRDFLTPEQLSRLNAEIQPAFRSLGLLSKQVAMDHARWDYQQLAQGLTDAKGLPVPRFDTAEIARLVAKR